jgi:P4 family phage/plasmid primase-like protien
MSYDKNQLSVYLERNADLIPIHTWNKQIKGKVRGKTPLHSDWTTKQYPSGKHNSWIESGFNLGYRIPANELIVDMDPRNYKGEECEELIAELFGFFDWEELMEELPTVKTGGGGYHIYCALPDGVDYRFLRETLEEYPGVEFKRKGRQVLCAGSKHPSGEYYKWLHKAEPRTVPQSVLEKIERPRVERSADYISGAGALSGLQLQELILDKLDPANYSDNDSWFPLLCAAHHATDGNGCDEFVEWSIQDTKYDDEESTIRARWESLWEKDVAVTIGTLIRELERQGEDAANLKAVLAFSNQPNLDDTDEEDSEEAQLLQEGKDAASEIDIDDMYHTPTGEGGVEGSAIQAANELHPTSNQEEVMKCLRLIKAASSFESAKAQEILLSKKLLKQSSINKLLKELDARIVDDLALLLAQKTLEKTFNSGKHLTCPPNGILWAFHNTHWKKMSDEFLAKLIQNVLGQLKEKMKVEVQELSLIQQAVKLSRIQVATLTDRIHRTELPPSVVNCNNGELWLGKDGTHTLKPHNYRSYLLNCLNVDYDPSAECPLFMETLKGIFGNFPDTDDMIRHMGELMGYTIQPYKNIASWWLFRGPGGDGKSTILKILGGILQDAQVMSTVKLLSSGSSNGDNHATTSLVGALNVVIEELPANHLLKDEGVKLFSENTKMECNYKGKDRFPFMYAGNLIMCSNGFPATRDLSHGMTRRANVIPFNAKFDANGTADIDRAYDILSSKEEMSGVLNFMLEGLQRLRNRGSFQAPESCKAAKEEWMGEANNVVRFVNDTVIKTTNAEDCLGDVSSFYGIIYNTWCENNGIDERVRKGKGHFIKDLNHLGLTVKVGGRNVLKVYGGTLVDLESNDEDW